jgi:hypothetical protein
MSVLTTDGAPDVLLVEFELARLDLAAATAALRHKTRLPREGRS